jgi:hypothetical protein
MSKTIPGDASCFTVLLTVDKKDPQEEGEIELSNMAP